MTVTRRFGLLLTSALVAFGALAVASGIKVRTTHAKDFDFEGVSTYAWHPTGAGEFKLLVVGAGNAEDYRRRFEPTIIQAVDEALQKRGFTKAPADQAQLLVNYYALLGYGTSAQEMGQFVPAVPQWGLPPLPPSTTSLDVYAAGSLVLDLSSTRLNQIVWRGVADAEIDRQATEAERQERLSRAIKDMLKKFPPKK